MPFLEPVRDLLGGGTLTLWVVVGGLVALWLAFKAVKFVVRLVALVAAGALLLSTAPWAGEAVSTPAAQCAAAAVEEEATGWQTAVTKRITVESTSADARCDDDGVGLSAGSAEVRLRTFFDVPFETWDVTEQGATSQLPIPSSLGG